MNRRYDATSEGRTSSQSSEGRIVASVDSILVIESKNSSAILNKNSGSIPKPNFFVYMKGEEIARIYDIIGSTSMPYFIAKITKIDINREKFMKDLINKEISIRLSNNLFADKRKRIRFRDRE